MFFIVLLAYSVQAVLTSQTSQINIVKGHTTVVFYLVHVSKTLRCKILNAYISFQSLIFIRQ